MPCPNDPNKVSEWKEKLRQANLGKKQNQKTIEKRRKKLIGKIRTPEMRIKDSINKRGEKNFWYGKHHSLEQNQAIGEGVTKTWVRGGKKNNHPCYLPQKHPLRLRWVQKSRAKQLGIKPTAETRKKQSNAQMGHPTPQKTRDSIGKANLGHPVLSQTMEKILKKQEEWKKTKKFQKWRKDQSARRLTQIFPKKDSLPEKILQKALTIVGINYEKHKKLVGQPDIFIKPNICVFADGDYWHSPKKQKERDKFVNNTLKRGGYCVIRLTEFDIKENPTFCVEQIIKKIKK